MPGCRSPAEHPECSRRVPTRAHRRPARAIGGRQAPQSAFTAFIQGDVCDAAAVNGGDEDAVDAVVHLPGRETMSTVRSRTRRRVRRTDIEGTWTLAPTPAVGAQRTFPAGVDRRVYGCLARWRSAVRDDAPACDPPQPLPAQSRRQSDPPSIRAAFHNSGVAATCKPLLHATMVPFCQHRKEFIPLAITGLIPGGTGAGLRQRGRCATTDLSSGDYCRDGVDAALRWLAVPARRRAEPRRPLQRANIERSCHACSPGQRRHREDACHDPRPLPATTAGAIDP